MGYNMSNHETKFFISVDDIPAVLALLNEDSDEPIDNIKDAFCELEYKITFDAEGNIINIWFEGEKLCDDYEMFQKIAPYVRPCSYLIMQGEDGYYWKWIFQNNECIEVPGELSFECIYEAEYEIVERRSHRITDDENWSQTNTLTFVALEAAYHHIVQHYNDADSVEPLVFQFPDSPRVVQIGYVFHYAPFRRSNASSGDDVLVIIRRVTHSSPIEEFMLPKLPQLQTRATR